MGWLAWSRGTPLGLAGKSRWEGAERCWVPVLSLCWVRASISAPKGNQSSLDPKATL